MTALGLQETVKKRITEIDLDLDLIPNGKRAAQDVSDAATTLRSTLVAGIAIGGLGLLVQSARLGLAWVRERRARRRDRGNSRKSCAGGADVKDSLVQRVGSAGAIGAGEMGTKSAGNPFGAFTREELVQNVIAYLGSARGDALQSLTFAAPLPHLPEFVHEASTLDALAVVADSPGVYALEGRPGSGRHWALMQALQRRGKRVPYMMPSLPRPSVGMTLAEAAGVFGGAAVSSGLVVEDKVALPAVLDVIEEALVRLAMQRREGERDDGVPLFFVRGSSNSGRMQALVSWLTACVDRGILSVVLVGSVEPSLMHMFHMVGFGVDLVRLHVQLGKERAVSICKQELQNAGVEEAQAQEHATAVVTSLGANVRFISAAVDRLVASNGELPMYAMLLSVIRPIHDRLLTLLTGFSASPPTSLVSSLAPAIKILRCVLETPNEADWTQIASRCAGLRTRAPSSELSEYVDLPDEAFHGAGVTFPEVYQAASMLRLQGFLIRVRTGTVSVANAAVYSAIKMTFKRGGPLDNIIALLQWQLHTAAQARQAGPSQPAAPGPAQHQQPQAAGHPHHHQQ